MLTRKKMIERTVRIERAEADGYFYKYRLSVKYPHGDQSYRPLLYSITVELIDEAGARTSASLREAFSDHEQASFFFNKLVENLATPINLPFVFEDYKS